MVGMKDSRYYSSMTYLAAALAGRALAGAAGAGSAVTHDDRWFVGIGSLIDCLVG